MTENIAVFIYLKRAIFNFKKFVFKWFAKDFKKFAKK